MKELQTKECQQATGGSGLLGPADPAAYSPENDASDLLKGAESGSGLLGPADPA